MKKFVLRVLAAMMVAAMMVPCMGTTSKAVAAEAVVLDLSVTGSVVSGDAPANNADGSVTFSGGTSMKCTFPLPETLFAGESVTVNAKIKFDSATDTGVRFYLVNGVDVNIATEIATIANEGAVVEKTFTLTAASDATDLLFASSGYGVYMDNVTLCEIVIGDKPAAPAEEPAETPAEEPAEVPAEEPAEVPAETPAEEPAETTDGAATTYTVKKGDCLWNIAKQFLGKGARYVEIFELNKDILDDATVIKAGQKLVIPAK